ncbi:MAG: sensor histidine kinase [Bdellovibrionota bacterium]
MSLTFWLVTLTLVLAWWGHHMLSQAGRIAELERATGIAAPLVEERLARTQRMVYWESGTVFLFLFASAGVLHGLYWRDMKRARGIHAFFASVTHELRTPLTSIRLQAESISDALGVDHPEARLVGRLLDDTMRLENQVERTLELSRVEGGGGVYLQPIELRPWLEHLVRGWSEHYRERVEFDLTGISGGLAIEADPGSMQVILRNLLENSLRHAKREPLLIRILSEQAADEVKLVFRDNGQGFSGNSKVLGKIFEKGPGSQGAGVGLYLISALMKRMGGRAEFAGRDGFAVSLYFREGRAHG